jgi:hypothetical protein
MRKKIKIILFASIFLIVTFFISLYVIANNSEPFQLAKDYILNNSTISSELGDVNDISLAYFGYNISYSGPRGNAEFEIDVSSKNNNGKVFISMTKESGKWDIKKARLIRDNRIIDIKNIKAQ